MRAHAADGDPQNGQRHRVQEEVATEHGLVDGDALVRRVEVGLPQERELAAEHGRLEKICVEPERNTVEVEPSMGHVVRGEVVVRAEVERRAESRGVVNQHRNGDQHKRHHRHLEGTHDVPPGPAIALRVAQKRPEKDEAEHCGKHHLRAGGHGECDKQRTEHDLPPLDIAARGARDPQPQAPRNERKRHRLGHEVHRRRAREDDAAARDEQHHVEHHEHPD